MTTIRFSIRNMPTFWALAKFLFFLASKASPCPSQISQKSDRWQIIYYSCFLIDCVLNLVRTIGHSHSGTFFTFCPVKISTNENISGNFRILPSTKIVQSKLTCAPSAQTPLTYFVRVTNIPGTYLESVHILSICFLLMAYDFE